MKIAPKPVKSLLRPETPAMRAVVSHPTAPREVLVKQSYQYLVTSHNVAPEYAKSLLRVV